MYVLLFCLTADCEAAYVTTTTELPTTTTTPELDCTLAGIHTPTNINIEQVTTHASDELSEIDHFYERFI